MNPFRDELDAAHARRAAARVELARLRLPEALARHGQLVKLAKENAHLRAAIEREQRWTLDGVAGDPLRAFAFVTLVLLVSIAVMAAWALARS